MAYYYPEGYFGPICDDGISELDLGNLQRSATSVVDERVIVFDDPNADDYNYYLGEPILRSRKCKVRDDGTYYDCIDDWINPPDAWDDFARCLDPYGVCYPWASSSVANLRLDEDLFIPNLTPETCSPFDTDINIRTVQFFRANGELATYQRTERSKPVTFPVTSNLEAVVSTSTISARWSGSDLVVDGTGSGRVRLDFEWDDNPSTAGTALSSFRIGGYTFVQTGGEEEGNDSTWISVEAGQVYSGIISGGTGYGGFENKGDDELCFFDSDGDDCNAQLKIKDVAAISTISNVGFWSEDGNKYAVWVNPAVCTLPLDEQSVTYTIPIAHTDDYTFEVGCDDNMQIFINDEQTPFMDVSGGIFSAGPLSTPYTATRNLIGNRNLSLTVRCTNSAAGFVDAEGKPYGLAYDWSRNPGGWYIKICRGGGCVQGNDIPWVRSGPDAGGSWGTFMETYAVFPSNSEMLIDQVHTATWNINVPYTGNYVLEYGVDDDGTWDLDGTRIITSPYVPTSNTYALNNLSSGAHTITCTVVNTDNADNWNDNPGGIAWTIRPAATTPGVVKATFDNNGNIVTTGDGFARVVFLFEYDDNPNTYGKAMDSVSWGGFPPNHEGLRFTQHNDSDGSVQSTITMEAGKTHPMSLFGNDGDFVIKDNGKKICYRDSDGDDCNAYVRITNITQIAGALDDANIIARSTDLLQSGAGNLIWTTRDAIGYEYYEVT
jgi:hypothetical protein